MSTARVVAVAPGSPADEGGVVVGDLLTAVNGQPIRDVIEYRVLTDDAEVSLSIDRGGLELDIDIEKADGEHLGIEVDSAVFDRVRTCDNHCEFCFIYQLPKGMRKS
ncbi:MAG TPA: PDZ domain-containing protein, partial [Microthrixaceae bacterium]|nr:PDZ domain-containing protein [Microthrixaceae bacterium]